MRVVLQAAEGERVALYAHRAAANDAA